MTMDEFKSAADHSLGMGTLSIDSTANSAKMIAFGGSDDATETRFASDFDNDFEDDFKESDDFNDDFSDDFNDDFSNDFEEDSTLGDVADSTDSSTFAEIDVGIKSVSIALHSAKDSSLGIANEIANFLEYHRVDVTGYDSDNIFQYWNSVYNTHFISPNECIAEYLRIVYDLWFEDEVALQEVLKDNLYKDIKMERRVCTTQDVQFFREFHGQPWFDPNVINRYSNEIIFNQPLVDLMKNDKVNEDALDEFTTDSVALMCCIRLLLADSLNLMQFRNAVQDGTAVEYTDQILNSGFDRFACIRNREDFPRLFDIITTSENCGKIIRQEVVEKYADAYYLDVILRAESQARLDTSFADVYLTKDLGNYSFVADIYDKNTVDLSLDREIFVRAKVLTDARSYGLTLENFKPEYQHAMMCLLLSKYKGKLSLVDYKKFLALCSFAMGETVLKALNEQTSLVSSYNVFWFSFLLQELGMQNSVQLRNGIEDNILYVQWIGEKYRKYYLQLDDFVLNPAAFKSLIQDSTTAELIPGDLGIILSNVTVPEKVKYNIRYAKNGSLSTWAEDKLDNAIVTQFQQYNVIAHANFLYALSLANKQIKQESNGEASLSSSVMEFLQMDLSEYYRYDKMFAFLAESNVFLGLFGVHLGSDVLKLFMNVYVYKNDAERMFFFFYCFFRKFYVKKLKFYSSGITTLDASKTVLFVKGLHPNINCLNFKTAIDSLDTFFKVAERSTEIVLFIEEQTINIEFNGTSQKF